MTRMRSKAIAYHADDDVRAAQAYWAEAGADAPSDEVLRERVYAAARQAAQEMGYPTPTPDTSVVYVPEGESLDETALLEAIREAVAAAIESAADEKASQ